MTAKEKVLSVIGWVLTIAVAGLLLMSATMKLMQSDDVIKGFVNQFGYPQKLLVPIGIVEVICAIIYLIPRTAVLGAILVTGYLGGAVATHARVLDIFFLGGVVLGMLAWFGLYFRDARVRAILPLR